MSSEDFQIIFRRRLYRQELCVKTENLFSQCKEEVSEFLVKSVLQINFPGKRISFSNTF